MAFLDIKFAIFEVKLRKVATLNILFLTPVILGPILILCGFLLIKRPPKKINFFYGYRTKTSMKSQEIWDYAQQYAGKQLARFGVVIFLMSFLGLVLEIEYKASVLIFISYFLIGCVALIYSIEKKLKERFRKKT